MEVGPLISVIPSIFLLSISLFISHVSLSFLHAAAEARGAEAEQIEQHKGASCQAQSWGSSSADPLRPPPDRARTVRGRGGRAASAATAPGRPRSCHGPRFSASATGPRSLSTSASAPQWALHAPPPHAPCTARD